ncbi:hypothetical protein diail_9732 [Diaporthe ilicicola]|nr:hypothetical protein diail_9732 [Diaporthe ilicicola]
MTAFVLPRQELDLSGPSLEPPVGVIPDLDHPPNLNYIAYPVILICVVLSSIFVLTRLYSKFVAADLFIRDAVTGLAFMFYWLLIAGNWRISYEGGFMVHQWNVRLEDMSAFLYLAFIDTVCYILVVAFTKAAILLEWMAMFNPHNKRNYLFWTSWITIACLIIFNIVSLILFNANCSPFEGNWNPLVPDRFCRFSVPAMALASAVFNLCADLVIFVLPQRIIWGLHITWRKRLGVSIVFLVGLLGVGSALLRLVYTVIYLDSEDATYFYGVIGLLSVVELTAAILVLCVPFTPKALATLGQTRAFASLRSWARSVRSGKGSTGTKSSSLNGASRKDKFGGPYLEVDEQPLATTITAPAKEQPLDGTAGVGIMRVREFTMDNEYTGMAYPV